MVCLRSIQSMVNYVNNNHGDSYPNTYNLGWIDHPNFLYNNHSQYSEKPQDFQRSNLECFGFGAFHVTWLFGPGIWECDPYGLTWRVQYVNFTSDHEIGKIIDVKRERLTFKVGDERIKPKPEKLILRIEPEPPPQVQKYEPPHRKKKKKSNGYKRWLDKWEWTPKTIESKVEVSFLKEPPWVLLLMSRQAKTTLNKALLERQPTIFVTNIFFCYLILFSDDKMARKEKSRQGVVLDDMHVMLQQLMLRFLPSEWGPLWVYSFLVALKHCGQCLVQVSGEFLYFYSICVFVCFLFFYLFPLILLSKRPLFQFIFLN